MQIHKGENDGTVIQREHVIFFSADNFYFQKSIKKDQYSAV